METSSEDVSPPLSVTVILKTDDPAVKPVTIVEADDGDAIVPEPLTLVQRYVAIVPSESDATAVSVTEFAGGAICWSAPAFTDGAALTTTVTSSDTDKPSGSVTVSLNTYVPADKPVTVVDKDDGDVIVADPPDNLVQAYVNAPPSGSVAVPERVVLGVLIF